MSKPYLFLAVAILCEVIATSAMKSSHGFTRLVPSIFTVLMYCVSFYALSQTLAVIPTGIAYAIWSGVGIVLISLVGWIVFQQTLDAPALIGMGLIGAGVVWSSTSFPRPLRTEIEAWVVGFRLTAVSQLKSGAIDPLLPCDTQ